MYGEQLSSSNFSYTKKLLRLNEHTSEYVTKPEDPTRPLPDAGLPILVFSAFTNLEWKMILYFELTIMLGLYNMLTEMNDHTLAIQL